MLYRAPFDGTSFGPSTPVDPYRDPQWCSVRTGSGTSVFCGKLPSFYGELHDVTAMAFNKGRLYYTLAGTGSLQYRWFSPESGIVGAVSHRVSGTLSPGSPLLMIAGGRLFYGAGPASSDGSGSRTRVSSDLPRSSAGPGSMAGPGVPGRLPRAAPRQHAPGGGSTEQACDHEGEEHGARPWWSGGAQPSPATPPSQAMPSRSRRSRTVGPLRAAAGGRSRGRRRIARRSGGTGAGRCDVPGPGRRAQRRGKHGQQGRHVPDHEMTSRRRPPPHPFGQGAP